MSDRFARRERRGRRSPRGTDLRLRARGAPHPALRRRSGCARPQKAALAWARDRGWPSLLHGQTTEPVDRCPRPCPPVRRDVAPGGSRSTWPKARCGPAGTRWPAAVPFRDDERRRGGAGRRRLDSLRAYARVRCQRIVQRSSIFVGVAARDHDAPLVLGVRGDPVGPRRSIVTLGLFVRSVGRSAPALAFRADGEARPHTARRRAGRLRRPWVGSPRQVRAGMPPRHAGASA